MKKYHFRLFFKVSPSWKQRICSRPPNAKLPEYPSWFLTHSLETGAILVSIHRTPEVYHRVLAANRSFHRNVLLVFPDSREWMNIRSTHIALFFSTFSGSFFEHRRSAVLPIARLCSTTDSTVTDISDLPEVCEAVHVLLNYLLYGFSSSDGLRGDLVISRPARCGV
uniref:Uncharacterized protein n=2 Tax=Physcomitrium patens TaxID=3218 RepID=A0A2K1ISN4_PHYPA|nr:hypothetical protein PHYPA_026415 [Physcomitrium patens]